MTDEEIFDDIKSKLTHYDVIKGAIRDKEKPMGFLLTYMKDVYGIPKTRGFHIAERLLDLYHIVNERYDKESLSGDV